MNLKQPATSMIHLFSAPLHGIELSNEKWKFGFTIGLGRPRACRDLDARTWQAWSRRSVCQRAVWSAESAPVRSCYEAGRDGFWLHRYLQTQELTT